MKKLLLTFLLCTVTSLPVLASSLDFRREAAPRLRDRLVRIIRVIANGDSLMPPVPAPKP